MRFSSLALIGAPSSTLSNNTYLHERADNTKLSHSMHLPRASSCLFVSEERLKAGSERILYLWLLKDLSRPRAEGASLPYPPNHGKPWNLLHASDRPCCAKAAWTTASMPRWHNLLRSAADPCLRRRGAAHHCSPLCSKGSEASACSAPRKAGRGHQGSRGPSDGIRACRHQSVVTLPKRQVVASCRGS